jgi:hypothetical protein
MILGAGKSDKKKRRLKIMHWMSPIGVMLRIWPTLAWRITGSPLTSASIERCSCRTTILPQRKKNEFSLPGIAMEQVHGH